MTVTGVVKVDIEALEPHGIQHLLLVAQQGVELPRHAWLHCSWRVVSVADPTAPRTEVVQPFLPQLLLPGEVVWAVLGGSLPLAVWRTVTPVTCTVTVGGWTC